MSRFSVRNISRCGAFTAGAPYWTRTSGLLLRRQLLYPAELKAHETKNGAGDGNRTHVTSLEGWNSTIELHPHLCFNMKYYITLLHDCQEDFLKIAIYTNKYRIYSCIFVKLFYGIIFIYSEYKK